MKLKNPTDLILDAAFAEHVCKLGVRYEARISAPDGAKVLCHSEEYGVCEEMPRYTQSADLVLPSLEKFDGHLNGPEINFFMGTWEVVLNGAHTRSHRATGSSFAKTAVIALLLAHGIEIEFTP